MTRAHRLAAVAVILAIVVGCGGPGEGRSFRLPSGELATPLLRTDGSRPDRWDALLASIRTPNAFGVLANVTPITDPALEGLAQADLRRLPRDDEAASFVLVADAVALDDPEFPILVVDISGEDQPSFRVTAACLWAVENNLSLANVDWEEFLNATGDDGVLRTC